MTILLNSVLLNALLATGMALLVWILAAIPSVRIRPGLRHVLWVIVLLKLVTPPLAEVSILPASFAVDLERLPHRRADPLTGDRRDYRAEAPVVLRAGKPLERRQTVFLLHWETAVADTRIHGTTRKQVLKVFEECDRAALRPLSADRFPCFQEAQRKVIRDGHLAIDKAYYSVPPEYLGHTLWVRWDSRLVRVFDDQMTWSARTRRSHPGSSARTRSTLPRRRSVASNAASTGCSEEPS